jgi:hypothetical protein
MYYVHNTLNTYRHQFVTFIATIVVMMTCAVSKDVVESNDSDVGHFKSLDHFCFLIVYQLTK